MKRKIARAMPAGFGHLMLGFEDGTKQMVHRGDHEHHDPKPGDMRPPARHEHVTEGVQTGGSERTLTWSEADREHRNLPRRDRRPPGRP